MMKSVIKTTNYDPAILVCPVCRGQLAKARGEKSGQFCATCARTFDVSDGYINLIGDLELKTKLDESAYDADHLITEQRRQNYWTTWQDLLERNQAHGGKVLEIGSGTGLMTWGLLHKSHFSEVHVSDISAAFLKIIETSYSDNAKVAARYYLCDANALPFADNTFDCIVGNSVLHHFLHYEKTLQACFHVMKKGGKAFFFEPVIQGKAFVAFGLAMLLRMDEASTRPVFTSEEVKRINNVVQQQANTSRLIGNYPELSKREDKYIFDIHQIRALATRIGYKNFEAVSFKKVDVTSGEYIRHHLSVMGIMPKKIEKYNFLFEAFGETIGVMMKDHLTTPMCYFVFEK